MRGNLEVKVFKEKNGKGGEKTFSPSWLDELEQKKKEKRRFCFHFLEIEKKFLFDVQQIEILCRSDIVCR